METIILSSKNPKTQKIPLNDAKKIELKNKKDVIYKL